jgi:hypothetical protein
MLVVPRSFLVFGSAVYVTVIKVAGDDVPSNLLVIELCASRFRWVREVKK